jgi:hypothetical protein
MELTRCLVLDSIQRVTIHRCLIIPEPRGSHATFPLRWAIATVKCRTLQLQLMTWPGLRLERFVDLVLHVLEHSIILFFHLLQLLFLLLLPLLSSLPFSIRIYILGKPDAPWIIRSQSSCSSCVFGIPLSSAPPASTPWIIRSSCLILYRSAVHTGHASKFSYSSPR